MVGRQGRYTNHNFISRFYRETALPPAGILQRSAVGLRLRVNYLAPSDAIPNRGGWAARQARQAPADASAIARRLKGLPRRADDGRGGGGYLAASNAPDAHLPSPRRRRVRTHRRRARAQRV